MTLRRASAGTATWTTVCTITAAPYSAASTQRSSPTGSTTCALSPSRPPATPRPRHPSPTAGSTTASPRSPSRTWRLPARHGHHRRRRQLERRRRVHPDPARTDRQSGIDGHLRGHDRPVRRSGDGASRRDGRTAATTSRRRSSTGPERRSPRLSSPMGSSTTPRSTATASTQSTRATGSRPPESTATQ